MVLTGAGVSAESGVPTFRGAGGFWREYAAQDLATPYAFRRDPSLVWEFYHYRREVMREKHPNPAHIAIAEAEKRQIYIYPKYYKHSYDSCTFVVFRQIGLSGQIGPSGQS